MLRSVLYELLSQDRKIFGHIQEAYRRVRQKQPLTCHWTLPELSEVFQSIVCNHQSGKLFVVIDGLDESHEDYPGDGRSEQHLGVGGIETRTEILAMLLKVAAAERVRIKIIILSRPAPTIERQLTNSHTIRLQDKNTADIEKLIELRLAEVRRCMGESTDLGGSSLDLDREGVDDAFTFISQYLRRNAQGVILWVALIIAELMKVVKGLFTLQTLKDKLQELPTDLDSLYVHIVDNLIKDNSREDLVTAQRVLAWVSAASVMAFLDLDGLREALAIPSDGTSAEHSHTDPIRASRHYVGHWPTYRQSLYKLCGPFVEVSTAVRSRTRSSNPPRDADTEGADIVVLLHQTVKDFLSRKEEARDLYVDPAEARVMVRKAVLSYISLVFPRERTQWVTLPLCRNPYSAAEVDGAARYLENRRLLDFCTQVLPSLDIGLLRRLHECVIQCKYTASRIRSLLDRPRLRYRLFVFLRRCVSRHIARTAAAWTALSLRSFSTSVSLCVCHMSTSAKREHATMRWQCAIAVVKQLRVRCLYPSEPLQAELRQLFPSRSLQFELCLFSEARNLHWRSRPAKLRILPYRKPHMSTITEVAFYLCKMVSVHLVRRWMLRLTD